MKLRVIICLAIVCCIHVSIFANTPATTEKDKPTQNVQEAFQKISLGQSKSFVLNLMGSPPNEKKAISTRRGAFECWTWIDEEYKRHAVLLLNGRVVEVGMYVCPNEIFH